MGMSESKVIVESEILPEGTVDDARRRRAREQVVRLFDAGPVAFTFIEGREAHRDAPLTILQPLPIVFEGLLRSRDRFVVQRFLGEQGQAGFRLPATYPRRVDLFGGGSVTESFAMKMEGTPRSRAGWVEATLERRVAEVVLAVLYLAGMS